MRQHGTISCYQEGCHCEACTAAAREAKQRQRWKQKTGDADVDERTQHELAQELRARRIAAGLIRVERERPDWYDDAACKGQTELFFRPAQERPEPRAWREQSAEKVCATCPARIPCRDLGREGREYGMWGGENEMARARAGYAPKSPTGDLAREARRAREIQEARG